MLGPNQPASPVAIDDHTGITVREYFAVKILAGLAASGTESGPAPWVAAVIWADKLIEQLNRADR